MSSVVLWYRWPWLLLFCVVIFDIYVGFFVEANENGLGIKPPLGWRSWNLYGGSITQTKMISIMDGIVNNKYKTYRYNIDDEEDNDWDENKDEEKDDDNKYYDMLSLYDLGYIDIGLDDVWQDCHSTLAADGMHYHDSNGNPLVNLEKFPSLREIDRKSVV